MNKNGAQLLIAILSSILLTSCVSVKQADDRILAWNSAETLQEIIDAWGIPNKSKVIAEHKYYIWNARAESRSPTMGVSVGSFGGHGGISIGTILGGDAEQNICSRVVEVDADNNVKSVQWTGDAKLCRDLTPEKLTKRVR